MVTIDEFRVCVCDAKTESVSAGDGLFSDGNQHFSNLDGVVVDTDELIWTDAIIINNNNGQKFPTSGAALNNEEKVVVAESK